MMSSYVAVPEEDFFTILHQMDTNQKEGAEGIVVSGCMAAL